jgi:transcriptional regulator with XRE-family HTH domain
MMRKMLRIVNLFFFRIPNLPVAEYIPHMNTHMEQTDFQLRLKMAMAKRRLSANALSLQAGLSRETVRKLLEPGAGLPRGGTLKKLAEALGVGESYLLNGTEAPEPAGESPAPIDVTSQRSYADGDVEIKAVVAGSHGDGAFQILENSLGHTSMPRGLRRHTNVYALIVVNDSMYPEHKPGEIRFATPDTRPKLGESVVIEFERDPDRGTEAMIGHLVQNSATIKIGKLNPVATIEIDSRQVRKLHRIAPSIEVYAPA